MKRRMARQIALQSLYHIMMNDVEPEQAITAVVEEAQNDNEAEIELSKKNEENTSMFAYIRQVVKGTKNNQEQIDRILTQYLKGWKIERLSRVDREVLRLAVYELLYSEDVPPKVAMNEAIELAKQYGSEESGKFVNGVLGKLYTELDQVKQQRTTNGGVNDDSRSD